MWKRTALMIALAFGITACGGGGKEASSTTIATPTSAVTTSAAAVPTTAAGVTTTTQTVPMGTAVVMDTDMALEGIMSILYLLSHSDVDVQAITISGTGLVHCEPGVRQALGLVVLAEADNIPVACGPEQPVEGFNTFPTSWRLGADDAYGLELPEGGEPSELSAPELLESVIESAAQPVVVYADGPLTNLAIAIRSNPGIVDNIEMVYIMGGAIDVAGNTIKNPGAEWNIWVDPVAADEVFNSGASITLVPLDATNQVPLNIFHLRALQNHQTTPAARAVVTMLEGNEQLLSGGLYFWDQLTAALLVDETLTHFDSMQLEVVTGDDRSDAGRIEEASGGRDIRVATTVDRERFEREFLSAIAGENVEPIVEAKPDITASFDGEEWTYTGPGLSPPGEYVVSFSNQGSGDAALAVGWLTGDATRADIEAWTSIEQPPFYELAGFAFAAPGTETITVLSLTQPRIFYVEGLDLAASEASTIGVLEISE